MSTMTATVVVTLSETRLLVCDPTGDRLIARLPPLRASHRWALKALLESLSLFSRECYRPGCLTEPAPFPRELRDGAAAGAARLPIA